MARVRSHRRDRLTGRAGHSALPLAAISREHHATPWDASSEAKGEALRIGNRGDPRVLRISLPKVRVEQMSRLGVDIGILVLLQRLEPVASARLLKELYASIGAAIGACLACVERRAKRLEYGEDELDVRRVEQRTQAVDMQKRAC